MQTLIVIYASNVIKTDSETRLDFLVAPVVIICLVQEERANCSNVTTIQLTWVNCLVPQAAIMVAVIAVVTLVVIC